MKQDTNYTHTVYACFAAYVMQAIVNNFAPLLFGLFLYRKSGRTSRN